MPLKTGAAILASLFTLRYIINICIYICIISFGLYTNINISRSISYVDRDIKKKKKTTELGRLNLNRVLLTLIVVLGERGGGEGELDRDLRE